MVVTGHYIAVELQWVLRKIVEPRFLRLRQCVSLLGALRCNQKGQKVYSSALLNEACF